MKHRLWSGVAALVLLAACGGGTAQTTSTASTTAPANTSAVTVEPTTEPTSEMMESPTAEATMEMETPTAETIMEAVASPTAMMDATAEATSATDETAIGGNAGDPAARQTILDAFRNQVTNRPFRFTSSIVSDNTQILTVQGTFVPPSRVDVTRSFASVNQQVIVIDDRTWQNDTGTWEEGPARPNQAAEVFMAMASNREDGDAEISNARAAGTEDVNGITANVYTYDSVYENDRARVTDSAKLWVDPATGLPVRLESQNEDDGLVTTTTQAFEYDDSITIEPPVTE